MCATPAHPPTHPPQPPPLPPSTLLEACVPRLTLVYLPKIPTIDTQAREAVLVRRMSPVKSRAPGGDTAVRGRKEQGKGNVPPLSISSRRQQTAVNAISDEDQSQVHARKAAASGRTSISINSSSSCGAPGQGTARLGRPAGTTNSSNLNPQPSSRHASPPPPRRERIDQNH